MRQIRKFSRRPLSGWNTQGKQQQVQIKFQLWNIAWQCPTETYFCLIAGSLFQAFRQWREDIFAPFSYSLRLSPLYAWCRHDTGVIKAWYTHYTGMIAGGDYIQQGAERICLDNTRYKKNSILTFVTAEFSWKVHVYSTGWSSIFQHYFHGWW